MRSTKPLNRTFKPKTTVRKNKIVTERHFRKYQTEKHRTEKTKTVRVEALCPHCGKKIVLVMK